MNYLHYFFKNCAYWKLFQIKVKTCKWIRLLYLSSACIGILALASFVGHTVCRGHASQRGNVGGRGHLAGREL